MKRKFLAFAVALAAATAFLLVSVRPWDDGATATATTEPTADPTATSVTAAPLPLPTPPPASATPQSSASTSTILLARATRLADGDSFEVDWIDTAPADLGRAEVRLLGINAPEAQACFGSEARSVLQNLIGDREILVEVVETENGGFGRQIANVWVDDDLVNLQMVEAGAALSLTGDGEFADLITQAQHDARAQGLGLWTACAAESTVEITDLHADAPGRDDFNPNGEWIEIRNTGVVAIDLTGWGIRDESTRHRFTFPDGFGLEAGASTRIGSGCEWNDGDDRNDGEPDLFWCASDPVWNNTGDTAYLVEGSGRFVDQWSYDG